MTAAGEEMQKVDLSPDERAGLLTLPGLLAAHSYPAQTNPIERGIFVREQLLCSPLPDPPADLMPVPPPVDLDSTGRDRFSQHSASPACKGCHQLIDPVGFGFENYDAIGKYRIQDNGKPVDASGEMMDTQDIDGTFVGAVELAAKMAESEQVKNCLALSRFRAAVGRPRDQADACTIDFLENGFESSSSSILDLSITITQSDAFRLKKLR